MKEWFYARHHPEGRRMVFRTNAVVEVSETETGVLLHFENDIRVATDSYDLASFVSNVLEDDDISIALNDENKQRLF
jgi:hypothetical protein